MAETDPGAVIDPVRGLLRLEGLAIFATATTLYFAAGFPLWLYLLLCLAPDLSFFAYAAGSRAGSWAYNLAHSYATGLVLAMIGHFGGVPGATIAGLMLLAHAGADRALGYGLKYDTPRHTHLGRIGRR